MAGKRLSIALTLNDKQFQSGLRKATRSMTKFGKSMQRTGKTLSTSLTLPVLAFGAASVKAFDEQIKAETKLRTALGEDEKAFARLKKQAQELQKITLFGDEATIEAAAFLAQLGLNENAISRLLPLIQDFATAQNMQLGDAAKLVAKSVGSSTNALSRYGITIEGAVGETERLDSAVNALSTAFGGTSEAIAKEGLGAFQQLKNELGDVSEEFGKLILDNIEPLKKSISELTGFLRGLNTAQKQTALRIAGIAAVAGPLIIILGKVATAVSTIVRIFMAFTPVGRAISIVLAGLTLAINPLKKAFQSFTKIGGDFKNMVSTTGDVLKTSPLFDSSNYAKVDKEVKKITKSFSKFKEVASMDAIAAGPVSSSGGQTSAAPIFATDGSWFSQMQKNLQIMNNINDLSEEMSQNFESFGGAIQQAFATALVSQGDFFKVFIDNAKRALAQIAAQIAAMAILNALLGGTGLGTKLGFKSIGGLKGIPKLFGFADGGMVTGATIAMVGEGPGTSMSNPEVIAPLDKLQGMIGNAGGGQVEVVGKISGADILLASDRAKGNRNRTRGY